MTEWIPTIRKFSSQVLIHIIIGSASKSGRKTRKQRPNGKKNGASRAPTRDARAPTRDARTLEGHYARVPYALLPRVGAGQRRRVRRFACSAGRAGWVRAPDVCPLPGEDAPHQPVIDTCRSPVPPLSSARRPTRGGLHPLSCLHFQGLFPVSIYFLPIFLSSNP